MEKDQAIALIKGRIMDEYRKHPQLDWANIAARKLYEQWNEYFLDNKPKDFDIGKYVKVLSCFNGHEFEIGEIVCVILKSDFDNTWLCKNEEGVQWYLHEKEGEVINLKNQKTVK